MHKENLIRSAVFTQEPVGTVTARRHWNAMLRSRTLRAAVVAATLLLPAACGGKSDKQDNSQTVVPAGAMVKLERIDDSLCKPATPDGGVTSKLLNALAFTLAGAMRPPHGMERTHDPKDQRPAAIKPPSPPAGPKPTGIVTTTPAPTPTASAPRPSSTTTSPVTASPSASRTANQPRPLPAPTSTPESQAERERAITGMLPPVSATAMPVPPVPEVPTPINHCGESRAYIEVSSTSRAPLNTSPEITDPGNKAYIVGYNDLLRASDIQDPIDGMYKLDRNVPVLGEVL